MFIIENWTFFPFWKHIWYNFSVLVPPDFHYDAIEFSSVQYTALVFCSNSPPFEILALRLFKPTSKLTRAPPQPENILLDESFHEFREQENNLKSVKSKQLFTLPSGTCCAVKGCGGLHSVKKTLTFCF